MIVKVKFWAIKYYIPVVLIHHTAITSQHLVKCNIVKPAVIYHLKQPYIYHIAKILTYE